MGADRFPRGSFVLWVIQAVFAMILVLKEKIKTIIYPSKDA